MQSPSAPSITLLDCTLRDGGHVNGFRFGESAIAATVRGLCESGVDIVELGFLKDGHHGTDQTLFTCTDQAKRLIPATRGCTEFSMMIRPDWYDIGQLEPCDGQIRTIRFAFHKRDLALAVAQADRARAFGYRVCLNPVNVTGYESKELADVLAALNDVAPDTIAIVDTFGALLPEDLERIMILFETALDNTIGLGLHLHENLSLSLGLAHQFIKCASPSRRLIIDSSLLGMGREPGNLCTELFMQYLNRCHGRSYRLAPAYDVIAEVIDPIRRVLPWGYMPAYAITAFGRMHRSYAEFLLGKSDVSLTDIDTILAQIVNADDRANYNEALVESLYLRLVERR